MNILQRGVVLLIGGGIVVSLMNPPVIKKIHGVPFAAIPQKAESSVMQQTGRSLDSLYREYVEGGEQARIWARNFTIRQEVLDWSRISLRLVLVLLPGMAVFLGFSSFTKSKIKE